jgi:nicotinamidase-related amidase
MDEFTRADFRYAPEEIPDADLADYARAGYGSKPLDLSGTPAVVVIDMTDEFVDPAYPNGSDAGHQCTEHVAALLETTRERGLPTVFTHNPGVKTDAELGQWLETVGSYEQPPPEACEITDALAPRDDEPVLHSAKPSGFFGTQLESILNHYGVDTLIVTGMTTSGCIRATVIDAFSYNYDVVVPHDCVADRATVPHRVNLFDMGMKYATISDLDEIRDELTATQ